MKRTYTDLIAAAEAEIETLDVEGMAAAVADPGTTVVDIRDVREVQRTGTIPGAIHAPRGMLEFWVDPTSPYHRPEFGEDKKFVFFCAGGWRSALATQAVQDMGLEPVAHLGGGFTAWAEAGGEVEERQRR